VLLSLNSETGLRGKEEEGERIREERQERQDNNNLGQERKEKKKETERHKEGQRDRKMSLPMNQFRLGNAQRFQCFDRTRRVDRRMMRSFIKRF
jgi:hypothetical protein